MISIALMKTTFPLISGRKQEANSHASKPADNLLFLRNGASYILEQVDTAAAFLPDLLSVMDDEGIKLLLYHLEPLFTCLRTRLHACAQLFDMLAQALGPNKTAKTFLKCLVSLFDSHALENYEVIIRQTFLSQIIVRFGLDGFLKHFISFVVDAVAFKSKVTSAADKGDRLSVYSGEGVTPGIPAPESEYSPKDVPPDIDDDLNFPGNFLEEATEDQVVKIGRYSMAIEDLETDIKNLNSSMNVQSFDEDRSGVGKDEEVTLLPRGITDDEGDGQLFHGIVSEDDERVDEADGAHSSKIVSFSKIHDGVEIGGEVLDVISRNVDANGFSNGFEDIQLLSVKKTAAEETLSRDKTSSARVDQGNGDDCTELEVLQGPRLEHDAEKESITMQDFDSSSSRPVHTSEPDLEGAEGNEKELLNEGRDHEASVASMAGDEGRFQKCVEEDTNQEEVVGELNEETEEQEDGDDSLGNATSGEEDGEESSSEEEILENEILEAENDDAMKEKNSGNDDAKPVVAACPIKTFYNGTKSKSLDREMGAQRHPDELTPIAISGIAAESIVWLAPRLGPVLTSKFIASQLLTMLPRCYMGNVGSDSDDGEGTVVNDRKAKWVLFCLANFCTLYGEAFMLNQYLPFIQKTVGLHFSTKLFPYFDAVHCYFVPA